MSFIYELNPHPLQTYRMCENKRPTPRLSKVIVLRAANECIYLRVVTSKDGGHTIRSTVLENPMPVFLSSIFKTAVAQKLCGGFC